MKWLFVVLLLTSSLVEAQVVISQGKSRVDVSIDGHPYTGFVYGGGVTKPYLDPLRAASGTIITRRFPMQAVSGETTDHPEHRGVWFGHSLVNGLNFYANESNQQNEKRGVIIVQRIDRLRSGAQSGSIEATLAWLDPSGQTLLVEKRTMTFYSGAKDRIIDFTFILMPRTSVTFGDHRDGVFSMRLADGLQEPSPKLPSVPARTGVMRSASGCETESQCWGKASDWMDYSGTINGDKVGVAILDHPSNPRHPTHWQARGYGLFAANIFGLREFSRNTEPDGSLTVLPGHSLRFRYRVFIHSGNNAKTADMEQAYRVYASSLQ